MGTNVFCVCVPDFTVEDNENMDPVVQYLMFPRALTSPTCYLYMYNLSRIHLPTCSHNKIAGI